MRSMCADPRLGAALPFQPWPCKAGDTEICSGGPKRKPNLGQVQQFCVIFLTGMRPSIRRRPSAPIDHPDLNKEAKSDTKRV